MGLEWEAQLFLYFQSLVSIYKAGITVSPPKSGLSGLV